MDEIPDVLPKISGIKGFCSVGDAAILYTDEIVYDATNAKRAKFERIVGVHRANGLVVVVCRRGIEVLNGNESDEFYF